MTQNKEAHTHKSDNEMQWMIEYMKESVVVCGQQLTTVFMPIHVLVH